jgi:hypothetical protein
MPLSREQLEAIGKIDGGTSIIDQIESDLETAVNPYKDSIAKLTRENVERKRTIQEFKTHVKNAGLDPEAALEEQLAALTEKVKTESTRDVTPNKEVEMIRKEMKALADKFTQSETQRLKAEQDIKSERVKAAFAPKLPDHFGPAADLVLRAGLIDGVITTDEGGQPGVKVGEDFFLLSDGNGEKALNALRQMHPQLAVSKQKGGAGDTGANGGKGNKSEKAMTTEQYHEQVSKGTDLTKFFAEGGIIKDE